MSNKFFKVSILTMILTLLISTISPSFAQSNENKLSSNEFAYDENGDKRYIEKKIENGIHTAIVTNEKGEKIGSFSLDTNKNEAYLNEKKLTDKELEGLEELASILNNDYSTLSQEPELKNSITTLAASKRKYSYIGTHNGSLWVIKSAAAAAAAAISVLVPGAGWSAALAAGSAIVGSTGTVYYKMRVYVGSDKTHYYTKRLVTFYKDSARKKVLYGPKAFYESRLKSTD